MKHFCGLRMLFLTEIRGKVLKNMKIKCNFSFQTEQTISVNDADFPPTFDSAIEPLFFTPTPFLCISLLQAEFLNFASPLVQSSHKADLESVLMFSVTHS